MIETWLSKEDKSKRHEMNPKQTVLERSVPAYLAPCWGCNSLLTWTLHPVPGKDFLGASVAQRMGGIFTGIFPSALPNTGKVYPWTAWLCEEQIWPTCLALLRWRGSPWALCPAFSLEPSCSQLIPTRLSCIHQKPMPLSFLGWGKDESELIVQTEAVLINSPLQGFNS